jgi:hypothetical protein
MLNLFQHPLIRKRNNGGDAKRCLSRARPIHDPRLAPFARLRTLSLS